MTKIALLVPRQGMLAHYNKILEEQPEYQADILDAKVIRTEDAVEEARRVIEAGADIIIARGIQAWMIKAYTKVPVVDIVTTTQEIGLMIREASKLVGKKHPKIYMISLKNAVADCTYVDEIFDVEFHVLRADTIEELEQMVDEAAKNQADVIIGGDKVARIVRQYQIPTIFSVSTEDSIRNALEIARKMSYAADVERELHAQVESILDSSFNGAIRIDAEQKIVMVNRRMEELLGQKSENVTGRKVMEILPVEGELLARVMSGRQESCLTSVNIRNVPIMVMIAPIQYDDINKGAILSCHRLKNHVQMDEKKSREMYLNGYTARADFDYFHTENWKMKEVIELAKRYALSKFPVLLWGKDEVVNSILAQSIHNNSLRKNSPFVSVNCAHLDEQAQLELFFGKRADTAAGKEDTGILQTARYGTVFIRELDKMGMRCQYQLYRLITSHNILMSDVDQTPRYDVRVIAESAVNLTEKMQAGTFRQDLYYALSGLTLQVPALGDRPEDVEYLVKRYLENFKENYSRYLTVGADAMRALKNYAWPGGATQLESFCERLFLSASKNNIDAAMVLMLLEEIYPEYILENETEKIVIYRDPEAEKLRTLLEKHGGRREEVAKEMGISTTTLWRRMKKHGIV